MQPVNHSNVPLIQDKKIQLLSDDFEISADGRSAIKQFSTEIEGITEKFNFKIIFSPKSSQSQKLEFLKQFNNKKIEKIGKESLELGLGKKFQFMNAIYGFNGEIKKLDVRRFDGKMKVLDMNYFNEKEIEIKRLKDTVKTEKFNKKLHAYKAMQKMMRIDNGIFKKESENIKSQKEKINEIERELENLKKEIPNDLYVGDQKAIDILEKYIKSHQNQTKEEYFKYFQDNILNHPDLHKKSD